MAGAPVCWSEWRMVGYRDLFAVFGRIGLLSFGGPAAQIALMHRELVERMRWLEEAQFLRALSFCMMLPGPEAMQLATYAGWRLRGIPGGLIAGALFVIPGALAIGILALLYGRLGDLPVVQALFLGIKAAVLAVVIEAIMRLARRALKGGGDVALAVAAFVAIFFFDLPFPLVIGMAAIFGALRSNEAAPVETAPSPQTPAAWRQSLGVIALGGLLWVAPLVWAYLAGAAFLGALGLFFSKLAVVTFGGAYAVLAYMTQQLVADHGWITTPQMIDALGLAETTPGPLILVAQFVGMIAGMAQGGTALALLAGLMVLWVTFVPCFIWIFAGAPLIDRLEAMPRLSGALAALTAAVVGVIASLSLWFALHVLFGGIDTVQLGPLRLLVPAIATLDPVALVLALLAGWMILRRHWPLVPVLGLIAALALAVAALRGAL